MFQKQPLSRKPEFLALSDGQFFVNKSAGYKEGDSVRTILLERAIAKFHEAAVLGDVENAAVSHEAKKLRAETYSTLAASLRSMDGHEADSYLIHAQFSAPHLRQVYGDSAPAAPLNVQYDVNDEGQKAYAAKRSEFIEGLAKVAAKQAKAEPAVV